MLRVGVLSVVVGGGGLKMAFVAFIMGNFDL